MNGSIRNLNVPQIFSPLFKAFLSDAKFLSHAKRSIHVSGRSEFWEKDRKAGLKVKQKTLSNREHFKRGARLLLPESKKLLGEVKEHFLQDNIRIYGAPGK